jgi:hypothetical protein
MLKCTKDEMGFGRIGCRQIIASFDVGKICSDIVLMPLRQHDERIGLTYAVA